MSPKGGQKHLRFRFVSGRSRELLEETKIGSSCKHGADRVVEYASNPKLGWDFSMQWVETVVQLRIGKGYGKPRDTHPERDPTHQPRLLCPQ